MKTLRHFIIVIDPSQYMSSQYISRLNAVVTKQWLWRSEDFKTESFLSQSFSFM